MTKIKHWLNDSIYINSLSTGCKLCAEGAKMVILITGLCPAHCFYCPLSIKKINKDVIYANEWKLSNEEDTNILLKEAELIKAKGAGITGGDPLHVWDRTMNYIKLLKETFGPSFHIHLYTSGLENAHVVPKLIDVGLDEIRFHPSPKQWSIIEKSKIRAAINIAQENNIETTIEIPMIPHKTKEIIHLIKWANNNQLDWINLNELEFSEQNEQALYERGFTPKNDASSAVFQSQEDAYKIINKIVNDSISIGVHYCSSSFKDGIQLTNRLKRRAESIANHLDIITDEGTMLKAIIYVKKPHNISHTIKNLHTLYHLSKQDYTINEERQIIQVSLSFLKKYADRFSKESYDCYISEQYPTADNLEVERIPLN